MSSISLKLISISKSYEDNSVLKDFTYGFNSGLYVIKGASGIGKTTLLRIISGLTGSDSGEVNFYDSNSSKLSNVQFSYVFQEDRLFDDLSAIKNLQIILPEIKEDTIKSHLTDIGIVGDSQNIKVSELSGGMRRRVAIVRAILMDSDVLLMDEPLSGLDQTTAVDVVSYIKSNIKDRLFIAASHHDLFDSFCTILEL